MIGTLYVFPQTADRRLVKDGFVQNMDQLDLLVRKGLAHYFDQAKCLAFSGRPASDIDYVE